LKLSTEGFYKQTDRACIPMQGGGIARADHQLSAKGEGEKSAEEKAGGNSDQEEQGCALQEKQRGRGGNRRPQRKDIGRFALGEERVFLSISKEKEGGLPEEEGGGFILIARTKGKVGA